MTITTSNSDLAVAVRRVNAVFGQCGEPAVPALRTLWLNLTRDLHLAEVEGEGARAIRLIRSWQTSAIAAIIEAAGEVPGEG